MKRTTLVPLALGGALLCGSFAVAIAGPEEGRQGGPSAERREAMRERVAEARARAADSQGRGHGPHGSPSALPSGATDPAAAAPSGMAMHRGHATHGHHRGPVPPERIAARREGLKKYLETARQDRVERVKARRDAIRAKWGKLVARPPVENELRMHAWRVARLEAIKRYATEEGDSDLATRCDALLTRENARHDQRMEALKSEPAEAASAAPSAVPGAAPAAAKTDQPKPTTPAPAAS